MDESLGSRTSRLDDLLNEKLEEAFDKPTSEVRHHYLAKIASEHTAIDLAYAVTRLPAAARLVVYENLPELVDKIAFLINTDKTTRVTIFRHLSDEDTKRIFEEMPSDEAVWLLDDMSDRHYRRLMAQLTGPKAAEIQQLERLDRNSAGRLMTHEFFSFRMETTIGQAAQVIRDHPGIDLTRCVFVTDDAGQLQGFVPDRNLIVNPPHLPLRQVMRPVIHKVTTETSRDEVVDIVERYKIPALPVVDENDHLVGVITYEDVVEVMEDIADETIAMMAGTVEDVSSQESMLRRFLSRAPWLIVTVAGGMISASVMSFFQAGQERWLALVVLFVPLVLGMSGNVGIQCSTILVRSMAIGKISSGTKMQAVGRELLLGLTTGILFGALCGFVLYFLNSGHVEHLGSSAAEVGWIVGLGILGASLVASLLGILSPLFFARFGVDPAVASGPIVTACNDILSLTMYFLIARALTAYFF